MHLRRVGLPGLPDALVGLLTLRAGLSLVARHRPLAPPADRDDRPRRTARRLVRPIQRRPRRGAARPGAPLILLAPLAPAVDHDGALAAAPAGPPVRGVAELRLRVHAPLALTSSISTSGAGPAYLSTYLSTTGPSTVPGVLPARGTGDNMRVSRASVGLVLTTVFIDMLGLGLIIPIGPALIREISGGQISTGAVAYGFLVAIFAAAQFVFSPLLGRLSDRLGRKPVLVGSLLVLAADYLAHGLADSVLILFISRGVAGACAGTYTVVNAYIADVADAEQRVKAYGRLGAAFSFGFILGPAFGGLLSEISLRLPFFVAAGMAALNAACGLVLIRESHAPDRSVRLGFRVVNPIASLVRLNTDSRIRELVRIRALSEVARQGYQATWVLYLGYRFNWSVAEIGLLYGVSAMFGVLVSAVLVGPIVRMLGERWALVAGLTAQVVSFGGATVVTAGWALFPLVAIGSLHGLAIAVLQSEIAGRVSDGEQGIVQGGLSSISSLAEMVVPIVGTALFAWSVSTEAPVKMPGAALWLSCGALVVGLVLVFRSNPWSNSAETGVTSGSAPRGSE